MFLQPILLKDISKMLNNNNTTMNSKLFKVQKNMNGSLILYKHYSAINIIAKQEGCVHSVNVLGV